MSGFVAGSSNHEDPNLQVHLGEMSQKMAYRGDRKPTEDFSNRCAVVARYRDKSGYRVDTYSNDRFAIVLDGLIFNRQELIQTIGSEASANIAQVVLNDVQWRDSTRKIN